MKRVYTETVKKWAKGLGISGVSLIGLIFMYLIAIGVISNVSYSGDVVCAGTIEDPCYAFINFTAEEDIFIYPTGYDPWGRETLFNFNPGVKSWRLERSWGTGWRNIPINTTCTGTWCGAKDNKGCAYSMAFRKNRDYQIRIVAYKNSPTDTLKWGAFSGVDEIDPFWYGVNETPTSLVSGNISVELGIPINFTTNLTGATTTCVDIDHPEYGDNYSCGSPNANFTINISYFRETEFNDGTTEKTMDDTFYFLNDSCRNGCTGSYVTSNAFEVCTNMSINTSGTLSAQVRLTSTWAAGESDAVVRIRSADGTLLESENFPIVTGQYYYYKYSDNYYPAGTYGFCLKHTEQGESIGFNNGDYITGAPDYTTFPNYQIDLITGEVIPSSYGNGASMRVYSTGAPVYIKGHQYDEVQDFQINLTGIETAKDVKIFINGTLSNTLGFIYNISQGNISSTNETEFNLVSGNSTTFSIPKGATVTNTTMNFTGGNITWEISEYIIPQTWSSSYDPPSPALPTGTQSWFSVVSQAVDGSVFSSTGPWIDGPTFWNVEWLAYIYENYTKDLNLIFGNWSSGYRCSDNPDITFDTDCWSGSSWIEILSDSGNSCFGTPSYEYRTFTIPSTCTNQSILQIKNTLQYGDIGVGVVERATYAEGKVNYYRYGYPENLTIEVGIVDGSYEYQGFGELTGSDSTTDFVAEVNSYLDTCAADDDGFCDVPIYFSSDDGGILTIDNFEVLYTYDPNPISISSSVVQNFLNSSSGETVIPIMISMISGSLNISDLRYDYKGGNDTIEVFVWDYSSTLTDQSINNFYDEAASTNISLGTFTKFLDIPMEATLSWASLNLTGYNQSGYCYQEFTDVATDCGGLDTGNTSVPEGNWYSQRNEYTYDGNWATGSHSYYGTVYGWMNYTKPTDSGIDGTYWQIKSGTGTENLSLSAACWSQSPLQLRFAGTTSASCWYCYNGTAYETLLGGVNREIYEEAMWWNITSYPPNVSLEIGDSDGDYEWNQSGYLQNNITGNLSADIATVISDGCVCDSCELKNFNHICSVPFIFDTSSVGELELHNLNVTYETMGNLSNNETLDVFAYFSSFFKNLPYTWANKIFFMPKTNSSKNVTAYGQTTTIPAYNLTTTNYGGDINLSIKVDESFSCLNITWNNIATKNESNVINTTWQTINSNVEYLNNTKIWLWADFDNCNASNQKILQPFLQIEGYCIDCEWI